jgi:hypothetical protein
MGVSYSKMEVALVVEICGVLRLLLLYMGKDVAKKQQNLALDIEPF